MFVLIISIIVTYSNCEVLHVRNVIFWSQNSWEHKIMALCVFVGFFFWLKAMAYTE